jgi:hypothetical protein
MASGTRPPQRHLPIVCTDPQYGNVAFIGTLKEEAGNVMMALRLKVVNRQISEIETIIVRPAAAAGGDRGPPAPNGGPPSQLERICSIRWASPMNCI